MPMHRAIVRVSVLSSCLGLAALFVAVWAGPAGQKTAGWNVLLITMDTTRADRIGCYGYGAAKTPYIDALAARGARFRNAYSPVPLTLPAHSSILTGKYPFVHHVRNNGFYRLNPDHATLAEVLKGRGFVTSAFVA